MRNLVGNTLLRTRSLWIFGKARWLVGLFLAALGTVASLMGIPELNQQVRTDLPGFRCWFPVPMDEAKFTVAMSPFVTVGADGDDRPTRDGRALARLLYTRLESGFEELDLGVPYELRSPDETCPVRGGDREARAANAEALAATIDADVVIYGALASPVGASAGAAQLQPEFYVTYRGFAEAADLVGPHDLGRPLRVALPVNPQDLEGVADHPVNARARALSLIALGLASYAVDNYDRAFDYFAAAEETPNWPDSAGKEVIYLLLGNASSRLAATTQDGAYVDEALDYFDRALEINPAFARGLVGKAIATYQLALGDLERRTAGGVDSVLLDEAEALYRTALATPAPEAAEIALKIHFGLGQIFLVRHYLEPDAGWLEQARAEFQTVIDANADPERPVRNLELVGHAFARLGLIATQFDGEPITAVPLYAQAVALVSPHWQAVYELDLGDIYAATDDLDTARHHFEEALAIAELYGNQELVEQAEQRLAGLP
jgi:tetratricopeptide (TPR) repeat protein